MPPVNRRRGQGTCFHMMSEIVTRNRPDRHISFTCESISLFERVYGGEYREEVREMALDAMSKFGPGTPFENDERMLPLYRILGKYSRSMTLTGTYDALHEKRLFLNSAQFYADWADAYLALQNVGRAVFILDKADATLGHRASHAWLMDVRRRADGMRMEKEGQQGMAVNDYLGTFNVPPPIPANFSQPPPPFIRREEFIPHAPRNFTAAIQPPVGRPMSSGVNSSRNPLPDHSIFHPLRSAHSLNGLEVVGADWSSPAPLHSMSSLSSWSLSTASSMASLSEGDTTLVLPKMEDIPLSSSDVISPSVSQMKPGLPHSFILPPVFAFDEANATASSSTDDEAPEGSPTGVAPMSFAEAARRGC